MLLAAIAQEALAQVRRFEPPVVLQDLGLPPDPEGVSEGMETLQEMLSLAPQTKVIVVTGNDDRDNAVRAVSLGAYDFYQKPVDTDVLRLIVSRAFHIHALEEQNRQLREAQLHSPIEGLIATDDAMLKVCRMVEKVAPTDVSVLILGESGTGKELLARAVHAAERPQGRPFVAINCAAIPEQLLESELFGYEKGAFTGAVKQTIGKIETAERRHAVPRRDRRHAAGAAGQAAALPAGPRDRARRRPAGDPRRRAHRVRDQPAICRRLSASSSSARICTTASAKSRSTCRRCASGAAAPTVLAHAMLRKFGDAHGRPQRGFTEERDRRARGLLVARQRARARER